MTALTRRRYNNPRQETRYISLGDIRIGAIEHDAPPPPKKARGEKLPSEIVTSMMRCVCGLMFDIHSRTIACIARYLDHSNEEIECVFDQSGVS